MRHLWCGVAAAVLLALGIVRAQAACETTIFVQKDGSGTPQILDPAPMKCSPDQQMTVHLVNQDMTAGYRIQIADIKCKVGRGRGNPTKGFLRAPIDVSAGGMKDLTSGTPPRKPVILSRADMTNVKCGSGGQNEFVYKYVIRAIGPRHNAGANAHRDPDLEISQ